ncbi:hypothetical protein Aspvir_001990 [Aspergillus viridinutans]|uniref:Serine hydrolase domain-containing protein n=1 Tax=Aspergillus viridinutans TaxID=75553 RepID=A0A9P3F5F4_ASPVI|nr:uncharacterized protein Aspvir_001990 [Aspergillus viridinutans]GIK06342.1 hypothetical protein Aspvir_001990 [Aspergillus viridinutans]
MKILCLHGMGTSSDIFEFQTQSLRSLLPAHFEFLFVDGDYMCQPADGVASIFPPPFLCYYPEPDKDAVERALSTLRNVVEEEGPFDGVIGYSQGASLAASYMLDCQSTHPLKPPPFQFAMLVCSSLPFSSSPSRSTDVTEAYAIFKQRLKEQTGCQQTRDDFDDCWKVLGSPTARSVCSDSDSECEKTADAGLYALTPTLLPPNTEDIPAWSEPISDGKHSRVYTWDPKVSSSRISIPSAHVYGGLDPYVHQSKELVKLCNPEFTFTYDHGKGHDFPRSTYVAETMATMILRLVELTNRGT